MRKQSSVLPFSMQFLYDPNQDRGYALNTSIRKYDPISQIADLSIVCQGASSSSAYSTLERDNLCDTDSSQDD